MVEVYPATTTSGGAKDRPAPSVSTTDGPVFELEPYRTRMARYLEKDLPENQVFFGALDFAYQLHQGQRRKSGAPYITHPCGVAEILARELKFKDPHLLAAALLHDVVEDVPSVTAEDIEQRFGTLVAELVDGCTKLTRRHMDRATLKDLTHSKIFLSASRRLGVLVIKLADRLHNLRTLHYLAQANRQRIAQETVEVYAPIAAKFNIFPLKRELYHLALSYLYPRKSKKIMQFIQTMRTSQEVEKIARSLQEVLAKGSLPVSIRTRAKGLGHYYNPIKRTLEIGNAENLVDFVVVINTEDPLCCYNALGIINSTFPPIPRSLRDFIANPKNNGYRSLHVRIHTGGKNYLIKIRTPSMDKWATYGILSEWNTQKPLSDEHWQEISELLRTIGEYGGAGPRRKALIRLSEVEEIFVYSPKGDIYYLPKGSIVLDFAYRIHSELGDYCRGALVNNALVPMTHILKDGDSVEILTGPDPLDVSPDLEEICKTPKSRSAINKKLHQKRLQYAHQVGEVILLQEIRRHGLPEGVLNGQNMRLFMEYQNLKDLSDVFTRVGQDLLSPHLVLYYLKPTDSRSESAGETHRVHALPGERNCLDVAELDKAVHKFARCCNPYPGQAHIVTTLSERGLTFHHRDCTDLLQRHGLQPQQLLAVEWDHKSQWRHPLTFYIHIFLENLTSLIPSLARLQPDIEILSMDACLDRHDQPMVKLVAKLRSFTDSRRLFECLPKNRSVIEDYRSGEDLKRH